MVENNTNTALGCLGPFPHNKQSISNVFTVFEFVILMNFDKFWIRTVIFSRIGLFFFTLYDRKKALLVFLENP